ncbi:MAG: amidase [Bryobacterales bacterium]|nr:amidase [Bryobacterales bacterium]
MQSGPDTELAWLTIGQASERIRRRQVSSADLTRACLNRIQTTGRRLNAFITLTAEQAMADAAALDKEARAGRIRGPLHGIPVALKDLLDTAGVRTTAGSAQYAGRVPTEDAACVRRLKDAGAVILGKLNMDEFAYNFTSETSYFGPIRNPWAPDRSPGGSSGGSAAAVAAGLCYAALGSDTGGSIRLPAALCGVVGMKPSYGLVPTGGAAPLAWSLDHVGPLCRTARDAAIVLAILAGREFETPGTGSLRAGVPRGVFFDGLDREVATRIEEALAVLSRLLAGVRDVRIPTLKPSPALPELPHGYLRIIMAEAYTFHQEMIERDQDRYHPQTRQIISDGAGIDAADYIRARLEMDTLRRTAATLFEDLDVLLTPTAPGPAFALGSNPSLIFLRNTAPWNVYGLPSIAVPCGFTNAGLPVSIQITAQQDATVLALAGAYQQATDWHTRRPPA